MSFNGHSVSAKHAAPKPYEWYLWGWSKGSGPPPMPSLTQYGYSIVFFFSSLNSPKLLHYLTELTVRLVVVVAEILGSRVWAGKAVAFLYFVCGDDVCDFYSFVFSCHISSPLL